MNVLQHTRNELNLCLKQNRPDRSYRDTLLSSWSFRRLSLIGKIQVLKSPAACQLIYVFSSLRTNEKVIKEVNSPVFSLIGNQKGDKIKLDTIIND